MWQTCYTQQRTIKGPSWQNLLQEINSLFLQPASTNMSLNSLITWQIAICSKNSCEITSYKRMKNSSGNLSQRSQINVFGTVSALLQPDPRIVSALFISSAHKCQIYILCTVTSAYQSFFTGVLMASGIPDKQVIIASGPLLSSLRSKSLLPPGEVYK